LPIGEMTDRLASMRAGALGSTFHNFFAPHFSSRFPGSILYSEFSARMYILHPVEIKELRPFFASR
jgi:hypothetical protein